MDSVMNLSRNNRNAVHSHFITIPHCTINGSEISKEHLFKVLSTRTLVYCKIVRELHKDENKTPHLHAVTYYEKKITKAKVLRFLQDSYAEASRRIDVGTTKSFPAAVAYTSKEDSNPFIFGFPPLGKSAAKKFLDSTAKKEGFKNAEDMLESYRADIFKRNADRALILEFAEANRYPGEPYIWDLARDTSSADYDFEVHQSWTRFWENWENANDIAKLKKFYDIKDKKG